MPLVGVKTMKYILIFFMAGTFGSVEFNNKQACENMKKEFLNTPSIQLGKKLLSNNDVILKCFEKGKNTKK